LGKGQQYLDNSDQVRDEGQQWPDNLNRVTRVTLGRNLEEAKGDASSKRLAPQWSLRGITKTQRHRLQKMHQSELAEKREEEQRDLWFNRIRPMMKVKQTWREKRLAREKNGNSSGSSSEEEVGVTSDN
jgi:hypothetical protein